MQKYNVKLLLWTHNSNAHGHFPIYIRITVNRKPKYISTGHFIPKNAWDEKNEQVKEFYKLASIINPDITQRKTEIMRNAVQQQIAGTKISSEHLRSVAKSKIDLQNIFDFTDQYIKDMKNKRSAGTLSNYKKHILKLELYHGDRSLTFEDITPAFLTAYENYLLKEVGNNYTQKLIIGIRTMFNAAILRGVTKYYPFKEYELLSYEQPVKDYLTLSELSAWEQYADEVIDPSLKQSAVYFLLGCYTGLRISDWLTFDIKTMIRNDRVKLRAKKNKEWVTMPISKPLARNLKRMEKLPLTIEEPTINEKLKIIAGKLKINKHLTAHSGRHTFAITLCAEQGISVETAAKLMAITVATCDRNYYRVTNRKIDPETLGAWAKLK